METDKNDFLAYIKYQGSAIENGYMDARKSAEALIGFDEVIRFFLYQEDPELQSINFEIPVRIRKGSWEALIPLNIEDWIQAAISRSSATNATSALKKLAENDFKDKKFRDVFKSVFKGIKWAMKIAFHIGKMGKRSFEKVIFSENNTVVGVYNEAGELLYVPYKYLKMYANCPENLFEKITNHIEEKRELIIGINKEEALDEDDMQDISITMAHKFIFTRNDADINEILFPHLVHSQYIELDGHVTRGNENANTIGFEYKNHILTCAPVEANITKYKNLLFTNCKIKGYVDRLDKDGNIKEKRPRINFTELLLNQVDEKALDLFNS
jgi:hypothetical protein